jgi:hypothetical protein
MKIDSDVINSIFNLKIKIMNKKDKIQLSKYEDIIPMYNIYDTTIYPINKLNLHSRLIESDYRFIGFEVLDWIKNLYKKSKIINSKSKETLILKKNLKIMENYDISTLTDTSYNTLYKYSPLLGLSISICKRNSFHPKITYLKPYYTRLELIKLKQNTSDSKEISLEYLADIKNFYKFCKEISKNDISFDEIKNHYLYIIKNNLLSWVCFYSFIGSFLFNNFLRNSKELDDNLHNGLIKIVKFMENSPIINKDYYIYRFLLDDTFIINLNVGDYFIDPGFISTTRDPFYSPGLSGDFGIILVKIKIPANKKGIGLFIEIFSFFPKEEEFLLPPNTKLKLVSKNENFKYYHTVPEFEKLINRKYEFELIDIDYSFKPIKPKEIFIFDLIDISIKGIDRIDLITKFLSSYSYNNKINLNYKKNIYDFNYHWFDATTAYKKFYYNKIKEGIVFSLYDNNGYPFFNIELGNVLVINYLNQFYLNTNKNNQLTDELIEIVYQFGRIFNYESAYIFHEFISFIKFKENYVDSENDIFLLSNLYNNTIYSYLKENIKYLNNNAFINYNIGYWYLDEYFNKSVSDSINNILPIELKNNNYSNKELLIIIIEKYFDLYPKIIILMDKNIFDDQYFIYNISENLVADGISENFNPNFYYSNEDKIDENYKLIFKRPLRIY